MFWISYFVTFVLASAIAIALMAVRLVLSAVGRAFGLIPPQHQGTAASRWQDRSSRSDRWSPPIRKAD
jgi:hypothetical protein